MQAFTTSFEYCGAAGPQVPSNLRSHGWYVRNYTLYDDDQCSSSQAAIDYTEEGTFGSGSPIMTGELGVAFRKYAGAVTVTPLSDEVAFNLGASCSCGGSWATGVPRRLTSCAGGTCDSQEWYGNVGIGAMAYGVTRRLSNGEELDQLQFSQLVATEDGTAELLLEASELALVQDEDAGCPADSPQTEVCGTWLQSCVTGGFGSSDQTTELALTGQVRTPLAPSYCHVL